MTQPCDCCKVARQFPEYRSFCPSCLHCGARLIQRLGKLQIPESECRERRRAVLADWMAMGHSEQALRTLAKGPPPIGPEEVTESEAPARTKRR